MLEDLKRGVLAGKTSEQSWDLFRRTYFPGVGDDDAKDALLEWGEENGIEATMFTNETNVLCVTLSEK